MTIWGSVTSTKCSGDTAAISKLSDISLEYDTIFRKIYAATIGKFYAGTMLIPHTKVT